MMRKVWVYNITGLLLVLSVWIYFRQKNDNRVRTIAEKVQNPANKRAIDSCIAMLHTGDIVLRTGNDVTSNMFCRANTQDKTYSHTGFVIVEDGHPFIYHSIGGEDNPDEVLRRDSATRWFSPAHNNGLGISRFPLTAEEIDSAVAIASRYYHGKKKFDLDFDLSNDDKLYCTEFIYKVLNNATRDTAYIKPTKRLGYTYIAVDNISRSPHATLICQIRYK
ncbi:MAG TPA: hypothetical protein VGD89_10775 [Flavipsychrobacter sp.]